MAITFEQLYKQKLKANILTFTTNQFNTIISNDINVYVSGRVAIQGDEILGTIDTGNGTRSVIENITQITQPILINLYVNQEYTQRFIALLTDYLMGESSSGNFHQFYADSNGIYYPTVASGRTLYYTAYFGYNTPFVNPSVIDIGSSRYQQITITGTVLYADISLTFGKDFKVEYSTNGTTWLEIKNVANYVWNSALASEQVIDSASPLSKTLVNGDTIACQLSVIYTPATTNHADLRRRAFVRDGNRSQVYFKITDSSVSYYYTFVGYLRTSLQGGNNQFSTMTISIIPNGTITETLIGV